MLAIIRCSRRRGGRRVIGINGGGGGEGRVGIAGLRIPWPAPLARGGISEISVGGLTEYTDSIGSSEAPNFGINSAHKYPTSAVGEFSVLAVHKFRQSRGAFGETGRNRICGLKCLGSRSVLARLSFWCSAGDLREDNVFLLLSFRFRHRAVGRGQRLLHYDHDSRTVAVQR